MPTPCPAASAVCAPVRSPFVICALSAMFLCLGHEVAGAQRALGVPFELPVGQSTRVGARGLEIGFTTVPYDGRCPQDERCVWDGNAIVNIWADDPVWVKAGFQLHTQRGFTREVIYGDYRIKLMDIYPRPLDVGPHQVTLQRRDQALGRVLLDDLLKAGVVA